MNRMSDLIDRQQAVDAINCDITVTGRQNTELVAATIGTFVDRIKALPSAQPFEIQEILDYLDTKLHPIISQEHWNIYSELHDMISTLSSAQPEITRCRDCKYRDEKWRMTSVRWLPCMDVRTGGNWYCGSAERGKQDG